jgi:hypothetical protein
MRTFIFSAVLSLGFSAIAGVCAHGSYDTKVARDAVKALIALTDQKVVSYYGGAKSNVKYTEVTVEPHYESTKDIYKVQIRNADCQVLKVDLKAEKVPISN